jgi:hypothetical protein
VSIFVCLALYKVNNDFTMSKSDLDVTDMTPVNQLSAGLSGQVIFANRDHLHYLISQMKVGDPVELSLLSWICGDGVIAVQCSSGTLHLA